MTTKALVEKAIREGIKYADENAPVHRNQFESEDVDRMALTLSAGLIALTEERLKEIIKDAWNSGMCYEISEGLHIEDSTMCASRIIEALGKEKT